MVSRQGSHIGASSLPGALGFGALGQPKKGSVCKRPARILNDESPEVAGRLCRIDGKPSTQPQTELKVPPAGAQTFILPPLEQHRTGLFSATSARELLHLSERALLGPDPAGQRQARQGQQDDRRRGSVQIAHAARACARAMVASSHSSTKCSSVWGLALSSRSARRRSASAASISWRVHCFACRATVLANHF